MHLGGRLGGAILKRSLELNWLRPIRDSRALELTRAGEQGLREVFALAQSDLDVDTA